MNRNTPLRKISINLFGLRCRIPNPFYKLQFRKYQSIQKNIQDRFDILPLQKSHKTIVFLLPGKEVVSGGILSIFSICRYTKLIQKKYLVICVTEPGMYTYSKVSWFNSNEKILRWDQFIRNINDKSELVIHIPEYMSGAFYSKLSELDKKKLIKVDDLKINILNQNPMLLPPADKVGDLFLLTNDVTQTLAFKTKKIDELANKYYTPVITIYSYLDITKWMAKTSKKKLILLSPDKNENRSSIVKSLKSGLPDFKILTISGMSFEEYMKYVSEAFAVITFGEGYDGYFLQAAAIGTLSFSVYNETFFPNDSFLDLKNVYSSYHQMESSIVNDIILYFNNNDKYRDAVNELRRLDEVHSEASFVSRLKKFYNNDFECYPQ